MLAHASRPVSRLFGARSSRLAATGLLLSALVSGCDKVSLLAPSGTAITLFPGATATVGLGGSLTIVANVVENGGTSTGTGAAAATSAAGQPVQNGTVVTFTTTLGHFQSGQVTTVNGQATATFIADSTSGTASIFAFSGAAKSTELKVTLGDANATALAVSASPSTLPQSGGTSVVSARVEDASGNGLVGVVVNFSTDVGAVSPSTATTDSTGRAQTTLTTTAAATVTAASAGKSGTAKVAVTAHSTLTLSAGSSALTVSTPATFTVTPAAAAGTFVTDVTVNFGDGTSRSLGAISAAATTVHTYATSGSFNISATVTDSTGSTTTVGSTIAVVPLSATAAASPATGAHGTTSLGLTVTLSATGALIDHYAWDFGDGTTATSTSGSINHVFNESPAPTYPKTYTVTVTVFPTSGPSFTVTLQIPIT